MTIITDTRQGCTNVYMYTPACTKTTLANSKSPGKYCKTSIAGESTDAEGGVHVHPVHPPRVPNGQSTAAAASCFRVGPQIRDGFQAAREYGVGPNQRITYPFAMVFPQVRGGIANGLLRRSGGVTEHLQTSGGVRVSVCTSPRFTRDIARRDALAHCTSTVRLATPWRDRTSTPAERHRTTPEQRPHIQCTCARPKDHHNPTPNPRRHQ